MFGISVLFFLCSQPHERKGSGPETRLRALRAFGQKPSTCATFLNRKCKKNIHHFLSSKKCKLPQSFARGQKNSDANVQCKWCHAWSYSPPPLLDPYDWKSKINPWNKIPHRAGKFRGQGWIYRCLSGRAWKTVIRTNDFMKGRMTEQSEFFFWISHMLKKFHCPDSISVLVGEVMRSSDLRWQSKGGGGRKIKKIEFYAKFHTWWENLCSSIHLRVPSVRKKKHVIDPQ